MSAISQILSSTIFTEWHWFRYHFQDLLRGEHSAFSYDFINRCALIEYKIPGFTEETIRRMASICGKEKFEPHYEQLLQLLVEVVVFYRLAEHFFTEPVEFKWEPTAEGSGKNPELMLVDREWSGLVEIKCPSMFRHMREAAKHDTQLAARLGDPDIFDSISKTGHATRPLDNKVKDYVVSAEQKFSGFRDESQEPKTFLFIAWTEHLFEAISPLSNEMSGLFTPRSFFRQEDDTPVEFPSVDAVIVSEHLELVLRATREEPLPFGYQMPLDYGPFLMKGFQHPILIENPLTQEVGDHPITQALGAFPSGDGDDPRARPLDYVMWLPRP